MAMTKKRPHHSFDLFAVVLLLTVFALSLLFLIFAGANIYRRTSLRTDQNFTVRTAFSYLSNQVKQHDAINGIDVGEFEGNSALFLHENIEGRDYQTIIYCFEQSLRELYVPADTILQPDSGLEVLPLEKLQFQKTENGIQILLTYEEETYELFLSQKGGGGRI